MLYKKEINDNYLKIKKTLFVSRIDPNLWKWFYISIYKTLVQRKEK